MINVLVFPCASGIGQEVYNALKYHKDIQLYGANSGELNPGSILYGSSYIGNAPSMYQTDECIEWLNTVIIKYSIKCIFPAYDDAHLWLKSNEAKLLNVKIITSSSETTELCRSKKITYERFASIIRCPLLYSNTSSIMEYPVFIKPECGEGSKGCFKINTENELLSALTPEHIILEYLPGDEYTVDCFTDSNNSLSFVGARIRSLTRAGISILTETIIDKDQEFYNMAEKINNTIQLLGAWFFQVKRATTGELCLMEIAPRIAGAMFLYREQGINFPLLSIYAHVGIPISILKSSLMNVIGCKIYANHFYIPMFVDNPIVALYIDLDDTLLLSGSLFPNPNMIALLYEAKIAGLSIFLITRHHGILDSALEAACICKGIFDKIIHIIDKTSKKDYITTTPAIFIDDSFVERRDASSDNIYTFDVDSHEIVRDIIRISRQRFRITHE